MPKLCRASSSSTSRPVMITAQSSGIWNIRLRATALPRTSARSQAPIASSLISQLGQRVHPGYQSRQHCARSLPVTTPNRAEMTCMKIAIRLASANHPQQAVFELSTALQIRPPVSRIHVADTDENRRPDKRAPLLPEAGLMVRHCDGTVHSFQRDMPTVPRLRASHCGVARHGGFLWVVFTARHLRQFPRVVPINFVGSFVPTVSQQAMKQISSGPTWRNAPRLLAEVYNRI